MSRLDDIRARVAQGRVAVGLGTTCNALAQLLDDVEWLMPHTVTAAAELDALPVGSVVLDGDGDPWKKRPDGLWLSGQMLGKGFRCKACKEPLYGPDEMEARPL